MKSIRPLFLTGIAVLFLTLPSFCPVYYVYLDGYVQYPSENVTKMELKQLNFDDIKDTSDQAIPDKAIRNFYVAVKGVTDEVERSIGWGNYDSESEGPQKAFERMMDTVLPTLNLQDTVFVRFDLMNAARAKSIKQSPEIQEFYYYSFDRFRIRQKFVISSQAVVDLKRDPAGSSVIAYPSPAEDQVTIKFNVKEPVAGSLQLINSLGQEVESVKRENLMQPFTFNIQSEPAGTYFIRAQVDGENFMVKFVKD